MWVQRLKQSSSLARIKRYSLSGSTFSFHGMACDFLFQSRVSFVIILRLADVWKSSYRWFSNKWYDRHVGAQNNSKLLFIFQITIEWISLRLFLFCSVHQHSSNDVKWKLLIIYASQTVKVLWTNLKYYWQQNFVGKVGLDN